MKFLCLRWPASINQNRKAKNLAYLFSWWWQLWTTIAIKSIWRTMLDYEFLFKHGQYSNYQNSEFLFVTVPETIHYFIADRLNIPTGIILKLRMTISMVIQQPSVVTYRKCQHRSPRVQAAPARVQRDRQWLLVVRSEEWRQVWNG